MANPMMIQYLVGLCCLQHNPDAVEITVGDMVYDPAAGKNRDVDITITYRDQEGMIAAFKAAEVKKESKPLDVVTIEQLCMKFADMPQITHKAIFSTSGYSEAAKNKAIFHGVDLYTLEPWKQRIDDDFPDFKGTGTPENFLHAKSQYLKWVNWSIYLEAPDAPGAFHWYPDTPILSSCSKSHGKYKNMEQYTNDIMDRSAKKLFMLDPIIAIADTAFRDKLDSQDTLYCSFSHSHTMDVSSDAVYLPIAKEICQIASITISGVMQWSLRTILPEYYVLKNAITREVFSGATIADSGEGNGHMFAMIFPPKGRAINYHNFFLTEKQQQIIHSLKLKNG